MAISPVVFNGNIMLSQDINQLKAADDNKAELMQSTVVQESQTEEVEQSTRVNEWGNAENHADASKEGQNKYEGDGGARRRRKFADEDGEVFVKSKGGFNIKI
ncbi:MAG: hypothetical protein K5985_12020 [Lachnospiraceae bacterium]|nr:hypothetical protein [Lachnospiraceae bacterium]